jgi:hypothetical protein
MASIPATALGGVPRGWPCREVFSPGQAHVRYQLQARKGLIANLFYDRIRARIETEANSLVAERTKGLQDALTTMLATGLAPTLARRASDRRAVIVQIAIGIEIETFREKFDCDFDPDPDPDFERAGKCCTARI